MSNDEDLYFTFELGDNDNINAEFELEENDSIDCLFEINAAGAVWGGISGTLSNQEDLQAALDLKADKSELESDMAAVDEAISNVQTVVENNYNTLDSKIDNVNSELSRDISTLENTVNSNNTAVNNRIDATNQTVAELSTTVADNNTAINNRVDGIVETFDGDISALETAIQNEAATRANNDTLLQGNINTLRNDLTSEISNRTSADNTLQENIDTLSSDLADEVTARENADSIIGDSITALDNKFDSITGGLSDSITAIESTINNYGDIVSYNAAYFATANQGALADTALQPNDNISELTNNAGYITNSALSGYATENYVDTGLATKQDVLNAGSGISISTGGSAIPLTQTLPYTFNEVRTDVNFVSTATVDQTKERVVILEVPIDTSYVTFWMTGWGGRYGICIENTALTDIYVSDGSSFEKFNTTSFHVSGSHNYLKFVIDTDNKTDIYYGYDNSTWTLLLSKTRSNQRTETWANGVNICNDETTGWSLDYLYVAYAGESGIFCDNTIARLDNIQAEGLINITKNNNIIKIKSVNYTFEQGIASDTWVIEHNLGKRPNVVTVDSAGTEFKGKVEHNSINQCTVYINGATTGKAYLN